MASTFFNEIFSQLIDGLGITVKRLQEYIGIYSKTFSDIYNKQHTTVNALHLESITRIEKSVVRYATSILPDINDLTLFLKVFESFLVKKCGFSDEITVMSFQGLLSEILEKINHAKLLRGDENNTTLQGWECIKTILIEAHSISRRPPPLPYQHFDSKKFNGGKYFVGRDTIANEITRKICNGESIYLHGIGGIGKTEIVRSIVKTVSSRSDLFISNPITDILWIDYLSGDGAKEDLKRQVCLAFDSKANVDDLDKEFQDCQNKLISIGAGLLIVIDNIETCDDDLRGFCNSFAHARFLLSGRPETLKLSPDKFQPIKVDSLDESLCETLFKRWYFDGVANGEQKFSEDDTACVKKIIDLADRHTVTVELFAKLIRKQDFYNITEQSKSPIQVFLDTLIDCGFNLKFPDEDGNMQDDEPVSAEHHLMKQERRIIDQLSRLFSTMRLINAEQELLIKISTIPNLPFTLDKDIKKWFSLKNKVLLDRLAQSGWLQSREGDSKTYYCMHSVIAAAVRHENADTIHNTCASFIVAMTKSILKKRYQKESQKLLIQFSWSVADIFGDDITKADDKFFKALIDMYEKLGLTRKARFLYKKLRASSWYSVN